MCNHKNQMNSCREEECNSRFKSQEDLIKYKQYLEKELDVVNKTLQDLEKETDPL